MPQDPNHPEDTTPLRPANPAGSLSIEAPGAPVPTITDTVDREPVSSTPAWPPAVRGIRTRTIVFGMIMLVIAVCVLIAQLTDVNVDPGVVALGVMVAAGVLLIVGSRRTGS